MLYRILFAALIAMSASVTSAAPVLDAGDALEARMAKLEAKVNELEFADKVAEEHDIKEEDVTEQRIFNGEFMCLKKPTVVSYSDFKNCVRLALKKGAP